MNFLFEQPQLSYFIVALLTVMFVMLVVIFLQLLGNKKQFKHWASEQELANEKHFKEQFSTQLTSFSQQLFQQIIQGQEKQQLQLSNSFEQQMADLRIKLLRQMNEQQSQLNRSQNQSLDQLLEHIAKATQSNREELAKSLCNSSDQMAKRIDSLTQATDQRLQEISGQVEKRLSEGFEKTTKTFSDILQRLALIDDAQKKITELSTNVVSLQEVLNDKRSRGAFGEVQLNGLIRNVLPEQSFKLQHTLSNGKIADCVLFFT